MCRHPATFVFGVWLRPMSAGSLFMALCHRAFKTGIDSEPTSGLHLLFESDRIDKATTTVGDMNSELVAVLQHMSRLLVPACACRSSTDRDAANSKGRETDG